MKCKLYCIIFKLYKTKINSEFHIFWNSFYVEVISWKMGIKNSGWYRSRWQEAKKQKYKCSIFLNRNFSFYKVHFSVNFLSSCEVKYLNVHNSKQHWNILANKVKIFKLIQQKRSISILDIQTWISSLNIKLDFKNSWKRGVNFSRNKIPLKVVGAYFPLDDGSMINYHW